jgi:hypothetical protein
MIHPVVGMTLMDPPSTVHGTPKEPGVKLMEIFIRTKEKLPIKRAAHAVEDQINLLLPVLA